MSLCYTCLGVAWFASHVEYVYAQKDDIAGSLTHTIPTPFVTHPANHSFASNGTDYSGTKDDDDDYGFFSFKHSAFRNIVVGVLSLVLVIGGCALRIYYRKKMARENNNPATTNGGVAPPVQGSWSLSAGQGPQGNTTVPAASTTQADSMTYSNNNFLSNYNTYSTPSSYSNFAQL